MTLRKCDFTAIMMCRMSVYQHAGSSLGWPGSGAHVGGPKFAGAILLEKKFSNGALQARHLSTSCAGMQAAGWIVVILFGFLFALLAVALVWIDIKFAGAIYNSEQFNTAGRSIGMGLLAVDIVSHWTWASIM